MRPPTPNLSSILSSAAYIRDPSTSPTRLESPIDTIAQYLNIPDHQDSSSSFIKDEEDPDQQQQELTPTMQYATLASAYSPLLQHQREQQLQALQQQQCIPGLAQIYTPLPVTSFTPIPTSSSSQLLSARSPSAAYDEAELELDADDDYIPGASSSSRKRSSSPTRSTDSVDGNAAATASGAPPAPKRQRAAPSGPISTKDWVPPDVTGLNKREARLVKNRAAAFLSRQRKREEFEQMEIRVQELEAENARLRQTAPSSSSATPPSPSYLSQQQQQSSATASDHQFQSLLAQLAETQKREEALAAQLRDAQATLARQQQQQSPQPAYHQPVISHWPTMPKPSSSPPASVVVKEEAMDEDERPRQSTDSDSDSSSDSGDSDISARKLSTVRGIKGGRKESVLASGGVREKGHGSVALMVLLFSLSLLSGQKGGNPSAAGTHREGSSTTGGAGTSGKNPSQFSFALPANSAAPAYDFRLQQQQSQQQQQQQQVRKHEDGSTELIDHSDPLAATKRWATSTLDSLDDEFNYFDRQHHIVPSSGLPLDLAAGAGLDFGGFGGLGLGLGFDDAAVNMGMGMGMGMNMGGQDLMSLAYPSLNAFGSPFSLASSSSLPAPTQSSSPYHSNIQRAVSPSATSSSGVSTITSSLSSAFNRQLEVSVSSVSSEPGSDGVSFDLKMASSSNGANEDGVDMGMEHDTGSSEKKITVRVRKIAVPSSSSSSSSSESAENNKKTILLELTSSSSSSSSFSDGSNSSASEELDALNADFEALLGQGLGSMTVGNEFVGGEQWKLALAPRDVI